MKRTIPMFSTPVLLVLLLLTGTSLTAQHMPEPGKGTLVLGGATYHLTATLCDLPDQIPGAVLAGDAVAEDGTHLSVIVSQGERPGGVWEEDVALMAEEGAYGVTYRRVDGSWEALTPTEPENPSSPMDAGAPEWTPAEGALFQIDGTRLRMSALIYGPETGPEGWEGTLTVDCGRTAGPGGPISEGSRMK